MQQKVQRATDDFCLERDVILNVIKHMRTTAKSLLNRNYQSWQYTGDISELLKWFRLIDGLDGEREQTLLRTHETDHENTLKGKRRRIKQFVLN